MWFVYDAHAQRTVGKGHLTLSKANGVCEACNQRYGAVRYVAVYQGSK